jgi:hypothetical protein
VAPVWVWRWCVVLWVAVDSAAESTVVI